MEQVSMEKAARAAARMAAVGAMLDALQEQARELIVEARAANAHALAVKAGSILRGASGLESLVADGTEQASDLVCGVLVDELAARGESPRLLVSDLPPEMQA